MNPSSSGFEKVHLTKLDHLREMPRKKTAPKAVFNVMTIDLEEWFQVTNFEKVIKRSDWDHCPSRVKECVSLLLDIFVKHQVRATFFTLGWVARRHPDLIRRIHNAGHEVASHGFDHHLVTTMTPAEFRKQLVESKDILEQILGKAVYGYRAPSYSFRSETHWVIEELLNAGILYDSSIFPFALRRNPELCDSKFPCLIRRGERHLTEYPLSIVKLYGIDMPIAGGGYFRFLPYKIVRQGIQKLNQAEQTAILYFHPWEFDPGQPRVANASWLSKFRHYNNLNRNESKFLQLVKDFRFASFKDIFWNEQENKYDIRPQI